jgi:Glycosyltransferase like family 2
MQFNWDGTSEGHLATHIARTSRCQMSIELVPGLFLCQERSERASDAFMASAASMLVRRSLFELLGGFDERLPLSYEDVEICWRAWLRGWKTMHVPEAVCWHRVGVSSKSKDGSLFLFRGVLKGRILVATKLLPLRYAVATWIGSLAGLGRDAIAVRWKRAAVRCREIIDSASIVPQLLIEKRQLYAAAATTPEQQLDFFLGMRSVRVTHGRGPELDAPPL